MKKLLTVCVLGATAVSSVMAQSATQVTTPELWRETGGMMALGLSNNGRFIVGTTGSWEMFVYDIQEGKLVTTASFNESVIGDEGANEAFCCTSNGTAYGSDGNGGVSLSINDQFNVFAPAGSTYVYVTPMAVSNDGKIVAGFVCPNFTLNVPCYWENGEIHILEYSTAEEAGFPINQGCKAMYMSADGSIIVGQIGNRSQTWPMVYWVRQEDGSYEYVPAFKGHYEDSRNMDGTVKDGYYTYDPKYFRPAAISADGKTIVLYVEEVITEDGNNRLSGLELATMTPGSDEFVVLSRNTDNLLYSNPDAGFEIRGISNGGYMIGFVGSPTAGPTPVVLSPEDYDNAMTLTEAFPGIDLLEDYEFEYVPFGVPYLLTGISADGSIISGYLEVIMDEADKSTGYATFYIETGYVYDSVESIEAPANGTTEYFTIDGLKVNAPVKGLNIVRNPDGTTSKIMVK